MRLIAIALGVALLSGATYLWVPTSFYTATALFVIGGLVLARFR